MLTGEKLSFGVYVVFQSKLLHYFALLRIGKADVSVATNLHFQFRSKIKFGLNP